MHNAIREVDRFVGRDDEGCEVTVIVFRNSVGEYSWSTLNGARLQRIGEGLYSYRDVWANPPTDRIIRRVK